MNIIMNVSMGWFPLKPVDKTRNAYCRCDDESLIIAMDELSIIYWSTFIHSSIAMSVLLTTRGFWWICRATQRTWRGEGRLSREAFQVQGGGTGATARHRCTDGATVQTMHGLAHRGFFYLSTMKDLPRSYLRHEIFHGFSWSFILDERFDQFCLVLVRQIGAGFTARFETRSSSIALGFATKNWYEANWCTSQKIVLRCFKLR